MILIPQPIFFLNDKKSLCIWGGDKTLVLYKTLPPEPLPLAIYRRVILTRLNATAHTSLSLSQAATFRRSSDYHAGAQATHANSLLVLVTEW